jgi:hypothetical protein
MVLRTMVLVLVVLLLLGQLQRPPLLELAPALVAGFRYVASRRGMRSPAQVGQRNL